MSVSNTSSNEGKVLAVVTGASGFVGAVVALEFLRRGHSDYPGKVEAVLLKGEIAEEGVFDEVVEGADVVAHVASPARFDIETDAETDILKPAVAGTLSILKSCTKAKSVKAVVITSSSVLPNLINDSLANLRPPYRLAAYANLIAVGPVGGETVLNEKSWNNMTWEEATKVPHDQGPVIYSASKALAEKAAWDFVKQPGVQFSLATVAPTTVIGYNPTPGLKALQDTNLSWHFFVDPFWKENEFPSHDGSSFLPESFVSAEDVARAHIDAVLKPEISVGSRYLLIAHRYTSEQLISELVTAEPGLSPYLPPVPKAAKEKTDWTYGFEADKVERDFGSKYQTLRECLGPYAKQFYQLAKAGGELENQGHL
ncbi:hypothetical protein JCM11641_006745 [Rhodosporidiobolus odoratus]